MDSRGDQDGSKNGSSTINDKRDNNVEKKRNNTSMGARGCVQGGRENGDGPKSIFGKEYILLFDIQFDLNITKKFRNPIYTIAE